MTVIAWDGKTLAADKMATDGGGIGRTTTKIQRHGDALLAFTGSWDVGAELRAWWMGGADRDHFPQKAREDLATLIVIQRGIVSTYNAGPFPMIHEAERCAFGSGRDFAEAAMYCGKSAAQAVEIACLFQSDCGNGIDVLEATQ
jgi:hypothetical protein